MKKNIATYLLILSLVLIPVVSFAQTADEDYEPDPVSTQWYNDYGAGSTQDGDGLVPCGSESYPVGTVINGKDVGLITKNPCGFADFMILVNKVVSFILFKLVLPIAAIMFAYAGFLLIFSGGEVAKRTKAKSIFLNVGLGLVFAMAAWLIVKTIFVILGYTGASWIGF